MKIKEVTALLDRLCWLQSQLVIQETRNVNLEVQLRDLQDHPRDPAEYVPLVNYATIQRDYARLKQEYQWLEDELKKYRNDNSIQIPTGAGNPTEAPTAAQSEAAPRSFPREPIMPMGTDQLGPRD